MSIKCPACFSATRVTDTRTKMAYVARRRECEGCGLVILTHESIKLTSIPDKLLYLAVKSRSKGRKQQKVQPDSSTPLPTRHLSNFHFKDTTS